MMDEQERTLIESEVSAAPSSVEPSLERTLVADDTSLDSGPQAEGHTELLPGMIGRTVVAESGSLAATMRTVLEESAEADQTTDASTAQAGAEFGEGTLAIGRFRVRRLLGEGAFGAVYLADDPQLDRKVAIKIAKSGMLVGRGDVDRFLREARAAAHLRHPNIVPVYEVGQFNGCNFLVYEFVEGRTLGSLLRERGRLDPQAAADVMRKIAGALGYAHSQGVIHRDMKPDNVLLDAGEEPHIADFGLARRDDQRTAETREGTFMGTPLYMSPEQAAGFAHAADARSDVWSLGVMLQQMLTGVLPFQGNLTQILVAVQQEDAAPIRRLDAHLPRDLETICQKCLAKDPAQRYALGVELADELERFQRGEPILARPIGVLGRTARWARRNPTVAGLVGAVCATLLIGAGVSTYFAIEARQQAALVRQEQHERAIAQLNSIRGAVPSAIPVLIEALRPVRDDIEPQLRGMLQSDELSAVERNRLRVALASLFPSDPSVPAELKRVAAALLRAEADEAAMTVGVLRPYAAQLVPPLLRAADEDGDRDVRFRALCALATLQPEAAHWKTSAPDLAAGLLAGSSMQLNEWLSMVRPLRERLLPELERQLAGGETAAQAQAAAVLAVLFDDRPETVYPLALQAEGEQLRPLLPALVGQRQHVRERLRADLRSIANDEVEPDAALRRRTALFVVALAVSPDDVPWEWLGLSVDKQLRTELVHAVPRSGVSWSAVVERLESEPEPLVRIALLEMLSGYPPTELLPGDRVRLRELLASAHRDDPHPGVHSAAGWLLSKWDFDSPQNQPPSTRVTLRPVEGRGWDRDASGHAFAIVNGPVEFLMGADEDDPNRSLDGIERQHRRRIPRTFGIGLHEVTTQQYRRFMQDHVGNVEISPEPECPVIEVTWFDAAKYCRWLSEQAGLTEDEMCFPPLDQIGPDMTLPANLLERPGYRLPTAAEWEFACRAGAATSRPSGDLPDHLASYAWFSQNSQNRTWPVGRLMPNDLGLFDMHGNVMEWCQDWFFNDYPEVPAGQPVTDGTDPRDPNGVYREIRGGAFDSPPELIRTPDRDHDLPFNQSFVIGFRVARTYRP